MLLFFLYFLRAILISLLSEILPGADLTILKVFRTFRALRPLRVVNRNRGLKMVVLTLLESVKGLLTVGMVCLGVMLIFGILGVQLLNGKLYSCNDDSVDLRVKCVGFFVSTAKKFVRVPIAPCYSSTLGSSPSQL